jgi:acetyl-CoA synthetase
MGLYAYVICPPGSCEGDKDKAHVEASIIAQIGKIAKPDKIQIVSGLPKTRSGKIMRRILRKVAEGEISSLGDTTTLLDPAVVDEIIEGRK